MSAITTRQDSIDTKFARNQSLLGEQSDANWLRQSLNIPYGRSNIIGNHNVEAQNTAAHLSLTSLNFADTSLGGNRSINPAYQFTDLCDLPMDSFLAHAGAANLQDVDPNNPLDYAMLPNRVQTTGMGRCYCEYIDNNASRIFMQFGVPAYNSLTNYFGNFYDPSHGRMVNTGVISNLAFTFGKYLGYITQWQLVPQLCILNFIYQISKNMIADATKRPLSKFYYMKPTMGLYWATVTTIVNALSVNMHLTQPTDPNMNRNPYEEITVDNQPLYKKTKSVSGQVQMGVDANNVNNNNIKELARILPDIFLNDGGGFDIYAVALRYQRLMNFHNKKLMQIRDSGMTEKQATEFLNKYINGGFNDLPPLHYQGFGEYLAGYAKSTLGLGSYLLDTAEAKLNDIFSSKEPDKKADTSAKDDELGSQFAAVSTNDTVTVGEGKEQVSFWIGLGKNISEAWEYFKAEEQDGSNFVSFVVEYDQHISESISSNTRQSYIASKLNAQSKSTRNQWTDLANGNVGDNPLANTIEGAIGLFTDAMSGLVNSFGFSGLAIFGGRTFADIPEFWDETVTSLPSVTYNIPLRTPYGNPISILQDILVPFAMLLAGSSARSTGKNAYAGPYLCKLWQTGRTQIALGMITSFTANRGTGNLGWNAKGQAIGIDISITVTNLSKMLHIPITGDLSLRDIVGISIFDEDNNFTDYMAVLAGLGVTEQFYALSKWRLKLDKRAQNFDTFFTWDHAMTSFVDDATPGQLLSIFFKLGYLWVVGRPALVVRD